MKKIFSKMDKPLLIVTLIFLVFGLIMILSASSMESYMRYNYSPYHYFIRQLIFIIMGSFAFIFTILFPTKNYNTLSKILLFIITILLMGLLVYGYTANNAVSWYKIGPITFQPSEFAKIICILYLATYYSKNKNDLNDQWSILKPLILIGIIMGLVIIQPDLGTAVIIGLISIMMFYIIPIDKALRNIITRIFIGGVLLVFLVLITTGGSFLQDYQKERLNYFDPCERYQEDSGYQLCNSFIAFKNGNVIGKGLGSSTQKYLYLPESYTDFIFPIIVEEWGLIIGIVILVLYMLILYRIIRLARKAGNLRNSLICYGIFAYLLLHIMVNLMGVMGLIPLTGVPLPFLSYGGSYVICLMIAIGLLERVSIETNTGKIKKI